MVLRRIPSGELGGKASGILAVLASGPAAHATGLPQADTFVDALDAHYPSAGRAPFDPLDPKTRTAVFDPSMLALLHKKTS